MAETVIVDLEKTTTSSIAKTLVNLREESGATALGRVLTLIVDSTHSLVEEAIQAATEASSEHPMRVIVISRPEHQSESDEAVLNAQIRVGDEAGVSEVIILEPHGESNQHDEGLLTGLLLPDTPVITWWQSETPIPVAGSSLGRLSGRRITDAHRAADPFEQLEKLSKNYSPGDTDLAWTRITAWRAQLAAALDIAPFEPVHRIEIAHEDRSPSGLLLAAWLSHQLESPIVHYRDAQSESFGGIHGVRLHRESGVVSLERISEEMVKLSQPHQPVQEISLFRRNLSDCLAEELRRLDADELYGDIITLAVPKVLEGYDELTNS